MRRLVGWITPIVAVLLHAGTGFSQAPEPSEAARYFTTRDALEDLLRSFEEAARSPDQDPELKARARYEADLVRVRLQEGDFQVGDRIILDVEGEPQLQETFTVRQGTVLWLPMIGEVPLRGVLRSELEPHLTNEIGRFIKNPVVRAQPLMRVSVLGDVSTPGFFVVPADALLTDLLMQAGGPGREAKITKIRIERGNQRIWEGEALQQAIIEGRTLDQLNLRAGDRVMVPEGQRIRWIEAAQITGIMVPVIYTLTRIF